MDPDLIVIFITLLISAFSSGLEIAFVSSNRLKVELLKNKGTLNGKILGFIYKKEGHFIGSLLLGNNIALVLFGMSAAKLLNPIIHSWGIEGEVLTLLIQTVISTLIVLILAEFFPKAIFQLNPNGWMNSFAVPGFIFYWLLYIPNSIIMFISLSGLRLFNIRIQNTERVFSRVDLLHYVQDINQHINEEEELGNEIQILQNALDFSDVRAKDCMVPRTELVSIQKDEHIDQLSKLFIETRVSKVLVYKDTIDNIIGYAHSFDLFSKPQTITKILRPIPFVPEAAAGKELLEMFTTKSISIAVVVDEYGGTAGIVTSEDVIEQITGDIEDEHDAEEWMEEQISENEYLFSARIYIDTLNQNYKFGLPESEHFETLGGFIIHELESIPEKGQTIQLENYRVVIEDVSDRRIETVRFFVEN
jgi:putative hemolysin